MKHAVSFDRKPVGERRQPFPVTSSCFVSVWGKLARRFEARI
jgi:hypothetical protein